MEVQLESVYSVSIKRKKPWPKFAWLGEANHTELYMLDAPRLSTLSLKDGRTKKRLPALKDIDRAIKVLAYSLDGSLLCGLLEDVSLFLWMPGSDEAPVICSTPLNGLKFDAKDWKGIRLFVAPNGQSLLLAVNSLSLLFVTLPRMDSRQAELSWWQVKEEPSNLKAGLPRRDQKEAAMDAAFIEDEVYGPCWLVLWAFSSTSTTGVPEVTLSRVRIQFKDMQALLVERLMSVDGAIGDDDHKGVLQEAAVEHVAGGGESGERAIDTRSPKLPTQASFVQNHSSVTDCPFSAVHWKCTMYPLAELCGETGVLVKGTGSYIVKISAEGKVAAVVLNCRSARACRVVYVSAESEAAIAAPVYGHTQPDETGRSWWIADAAWTPCGTLLVAISKRGSLMLFSRLSGPALASVSGSSLSMEPSTHLPIHPLVIVQAAGQGNPLLYETSVASEKDVMRQHFSVAVHPHLPIALCSDGYLVSALKFPQRTSPEKAARKMVHSAQHLLLVEHPELSLQFPEEDAGNATTSTGRSIQALAEGTFLSSEDHTVSSIAPYAAAFDMGGANVGAIHFAGLGEQTSGDGSKQALFSSAAPVPLSTPSLHLLLSALGIVVSSNNSLEPPMHASSESASSFASLWTDTCIAAVKLAFGQGNTAVLLEFLARLQDITKFDSVHQAYLALTSSLVTSVLSVCVECSLGHLQQQLSQPSDPGQAVAEVLSMLQAAFDTLSHSLSAYSSASQIFNKDTSGFAFQPSHVDGATSKVDPSIPASLASVLKLFHSHATDMLRLFEQYQVDRTPSHTFRESSNSLQDLIKQLAHEAEKYDIATLQPVAAEDVAHSEISTLHRKLLQYDISGAMEDMALNIISSEGIPIEGLDRLLHRSTNQLPVTHRQGSAAWPTEDTAIPPLSASKTSLVHLASPLGESMVRSLGFLMARYFLGLPLMVPILGSACSVPAPSVATAELPKEARFNELSTVKVTDAARSALHQWVPDCALMLLLFAGEWEEAAIFCQQLGNWQLAYSVAVIDKVHNTLLQRGTPTLSDVHCNDIATSIIKCKIEGITKALVSTGSSRGSVTDTENTLALLLQAAVVGGHDSILLNFTARLVDGITSEVGKLPYLVPAGHRLPASPVFCQQQPITKEDDRSEYDARVAISDLVLQFCALLRAANCLQPCFALYIAHLSDILQTTEEGSAEVGCLSALQPKRQARNWGEYLQVFRELARTFPMNDHTVEASSLKQLHVLLRRLLWVLWYLHARDQLSALLRQTSCFSLGASPDDSVVEESVVWGLKLLCVSRHLGYYSANQVEDCVLTALAEMRPTKLKATLLAHGYPPSDFERRNDAIGSKFTRMMTQLRAQSVGSDSGTDGEPHSSEDPLSVVYIVQSKALASARQALSLPLASDAQMQQLPTCESEFDEDYLHFISTVAEHISATPISVQPSSRHRVGVHPFPASDTPLLSEFCTWSDTKQGSCLQSSDAAVTENAVLPTSSSDLSGRPLWTQLLPIAQFLMHWSDLVILPVGNKAPVTSSLKVSLPLEVLTSALHIREVKVLGKDSSVCIQEELKPETGKQSLAEQTQQVADIPEQEEDSILELSGGDGALADHSHSSVTPSTSEPKLLIIPQMDSFQETPGTLAAVTEAVDGLPQLTLPTETFTEYSIGEAVSLLTAAEISCTITTVATQRDGYLNDSEEDEDQQDSTTLSAVTSLTSEQVTGAGQHAMATPAAPVRYATGDSNPATESWLSLASLGEGGLEESSKQPSDSRDHTLVADGCTVVAQKSEDDLDGTNRVNGDGSQQSQTTEGDGAGIAGSGNGEIESQSSDGSGDGSRGDTGGGGGGGGRGGGGGGGGDGGDDDSLSSSTDSHSESSSEESVKTDTHTPQSEHTEQQVVPIKSKPVSSHPHSREDEARQETPERVTTTITTDLSSAGDLPPCPTGQRGVLPELPVSAVTVVTSNKGRKGAKDRQTMAGPPQSTPIENTPLLHPNPEGNLVSGRLESPQSPASPHLAIAHHGTGHCHQQEQEDGTTASEKPATLKTDELNSPTYRTWSSPHVGNSGDPVEAQGLQVVQSLGESGLVGREKEVAQLRRDVRKAVKQEMRTIVKELLKGNHGQLLTALDSSVSDAAPMQSAPPSGNGNHFTEDTHRQFGQDEHSNPTPNPATIQSGDLCSERTETNQPAASEDLSQPPHLATVMKESGVQPTHPRAQGVSSSNQSAFALPLPVRSSAHGTGRVTDAAGDTEPIAGSGRAKASFNKSVPCSEDTASCISAGERYSFQSESSMSELTPGQLEEAGLGQSQVLQIRSWHGVGGRGVPSVACGATSGPPHPAVQPHPQGMRSLQTSSLPQLSLAPHPEEVSRPSHTPWTDDHPQISLAPHPASHSLHPTHTVDGVIFPLLPLPPHPASLTPHPMSAFSASHQGPPVGISSGYVPVTHDSFSFPHLGNAQLVPPSTALGTEVHDHPPPPREAWTTKSPTTAFKQLQQPQEQLEGAVDMQGAPRHSSTFPLLTFAPKQLQQQSFQLLQLHDEPVHSPFPVLQFPPVKQQNASDLPLLSFPDVSSAERPLEAPGVAGRYELLKMPLKPFVPTFPSSDMLQQHPVQLQNTDAFYRHHQEGFKFLELPDDMLAHGSPVHDPPPAHHRHGTKPKRTKDIYSDTSVSSAGDIDTRKMRRKGNKARGKPASNGSDMSTAQSVPTKPVAANPVAEASVQVSLDLRIEDMKLTHPIQDRQVAARTQEVPQVSKPQKQLYSGKSTVVPTSSQSSPVDLQQFTESVHKEAQQLTKLGGTPEDEKGGELAPVSKESGVQLTQQLAQRAVGGEALYEVAQASEEAPLGKRDSATLSLGHPSGAPTRNFLSVEDIDPNDTLVADGADSESTLQTGDPLDAADFTLRESMASSISDGSIGASQQHEIGTSSKNILAVATADEPQAVKSPHRTVGGQPRKTDDILSKLKHVEAQLNALEATAYNVQREIKLDSYKLVGELVKRTTQAESCHSSLEGDNDVKVDRATYLKAPPNDHNLIGQVSRRASSGSVDGMSSQDRRGKDRLQRLPHYKQRTRSLPGAPLHERNREELRQWMEERRKNYKEKYKSERDSRIRKEKRPFVPPVQSGVQRNQRERQERRRELLEEHREKRVHDAYALMADIIHHQPQKSREHSKENRKHSTVASGTRVLSQAPLPSGLPRRAKRPMQSAGAGSTWTKTTGSSSSSMPRPVVLGEAVKDHQSRHKPLRKIASVEGLTAEEIETVTRLLRDVTDDDTPSTSSSVLTDIDWTEVDNILEH